MSKFKAGNKVRILDSNCSDLKIGSEYLVDDVLCDCYKVAGFYFTDSDLELVSDTKPEFKVGHGVICIKKTHEHNVGDVLLVTNINKTTLELDFGGDFTYSRSHFTPCPNPPLKHYKQRIAYALGADIELECEDGSTVRVPKPEFAEYFNYRVATPDIHAKKREQLKAEIERLQDELDSLGGDL